MKKFILFFGVIGLFAFSCYSASWKNFTGSNVSVIIPSWTIFGTGATLALDSAYLYGSSGDAFFLTFVPQESGTLTDIQVRVASYSGTWGSTDGNIDVEIREGLAGNNIPGTILVSSFAVTLDGSTTGWIHITGLSVSLVASRMYSIVIGDADGGATNYVTVNYRYGTGLGSVITGRLNTTINGYATGGTNQTGAVSVAFKIGSDWYGGQAIDSVATTTSGAYMRGARFKVFDNCTLIGINLTNDSSLLYNNTSSTSSFVLFADATNPTGSPLMSFQMAQSSYSGTSPQTSILQFPASSQYDLVKDTWYRIVYRPTGVATTPRKAGISGSPDTDLLTAMIPLGGNYYWTQSAGTAWIDESTNTPTMSPVLVPNTDSAGGSGGVFMYAN